MKLVYSQKIVFVLIATFLLLGGVLYYQQKARTLEDELFPNVEKIKAKLEQEFYNSYPDLLPPSSPTVVKLVAQETQYQGIDDHVIDGYAYNGQVPGPTIRVGLGETIRIEFTNQLPEETTIHFHGIRVPHAMDGVPGVSQDAISPGESFVYEFTPKDAGTFWYHPHVRSSEQVEKGLYGIIIVEEEEDLGFSQDVVWLVDDWRVNDDYSLNTRFNTMHDMMHDGRWGQVVTTNGKTQEQLELRPGEHIRLRMINASNARDYKLNFGTLSAIAIAVDGMPLEVPFDANGFEIAPGNRIDVDLSVPTDVSAGETFITDTFSRVTNALGTVRISSDVVQASGPTFPRLASYPDWSDARKIPHDYEYILNARRGGEYGIAWTINDEMYPDITKTILESGKFYKLRITNDSARLHPMHLHGQFFQILAVNGKPVDNSHWRDTVLLKARESIDIGIVPTDLGDWMFHCHALEHAEAGMMSIIEVR